MRILAHRTDGESRIAVEVDDRAVDLTTIDEFYRDPRAWSTRRPDGDSHLLDGVERVPPVPPTAKVLCLGLNYEAHITETGRERPPAPNIFARWYASLSCHEDQVPVPSGEPGLDWECELAVVIGDVLVDTPAEQAMDGILGYTAFNDLSGRTHQRLTPQWALGKNPDRSAPIGPHVVTADEFGDPYGRSIVTRVGGTTMQSSTTDRMIFRIDETIEFITRVTTLRPGDVIATGTPDGVGGSRQPPVLLTGGETVEVDIDGIGVLRSHIIGGPQATDLRRAAGRRPSRPLPPGSPLDPGARP
jgi:2-keto-4-pentenoate hydratase/2-oxohepta-3-ene-1,7-dioic acid hydratase in catechol pathway